MPGGSMSCLGYGSMRHVEFAFSPDRELCTVMNCIALKSILFINVRSILVMYTFMGLPDCWEPYGWLLTVIVNNAQFRSKLQTSYDSE